MKRKVSLLYTVIAMVIAILGTSSVVQGYTMYDFWLEITRPNQTVYGDAIKKSNGDNSDGIIYYQSGNSILRVEMRAKALSDNGTTYINLTKAHEEGGYAYAQYYYLNVGEARQLENTVDEYFDEDALVKLYNTAFATGILTGTWSPTTR